MRLFSFSVSHFCLPLIPYSASHIFPAAVTVLVDRCFLKQLSMRMRIRELPI